MFSTSASSQHYDFLQKTVHIKYNQSFGGERGGRGDAGDFFPKWIKKRNAILVGSLKLLVSLHKPFS